MNDAQQAVMSELCVGLGFCLPPEKSWAWFASQLIDSPEAFARIVYAAEGLDYDRDTRRSLKRAVQELGERYLATAV